MPQSRQRMDQTLKTVVLPELRKKGFKGSLPDLRRTKDGAIDLISFTFSTGGGKFAIEIGKYPKIGITTSYGKKIPSEKVKIYHLDLDKRPRLTPTLQGDYWFEFDTGENYQKIASEAIALINNQAEKWWAEKNNTSVGGAEI